MKVTWRELSDGAVTPARFTEGDAMWLGVVGPTAWCLMTVLHTEAVRNRRTEVDRVDVARRLGITDAELDRALYRITQAGLVMTDPDGSLIIPAAYPLPSREQLERRDEPRELGH